MHHAGRDGRKRIAKPAMHSALLALPPLAMLLPHGVLPHGTARVPTRVPLARMITDPNSDIMSRLAELEASRGIAAKRVILAGHGPGAALAVSLPACCHGSAPS